MLVTVLLSYFAAAEIKLPRIGSFFIHYTESLLSNVWKSLIIMNVVFVSSLGSTTQFFAEQLIESTYTRLGHEPGRATCLVVKCPDDELGTQLRRLWRCKFQPQQNVRECALDSQMSKGGVTERHFRQASTWKTTEDSARWKVAHGDVNVHHALEFGQTMVK